MNTRQHRGVAAMRRARASTSPHATLSMSSVMSSLTSPVSARRRAPPPRSRRSCTRPLQRQAGTRTRPASRTTCSGRASTYLNDRSKVDVADLSVLAKNARLFSRFRECFRCPFIGDARLADGRNIQPLSRPAASRRGWAGRATSRSSAGIALVSTRTAGGRARHPRSTSRTGTSW